MDTGTYTFRIIVKENDFRKGVFPVKDLENVESLISAIAVELELEGEFRLQYQDKDFNKEFFNLTDASMKDISDKSTLKIIRKSVLDDLEPFNFDMDKTSSLDDSSASLESMAGSDTTDIISVSPSTSGESLIS